MSVLRIIYSTIILCLALTGCSQAKTYSYFMVHPNALIKAVRKCQNANDPSSKTCQAALKAKRDFAELIMAAEQNRQQFGQTILQTQMRIAKQQTAVNRLQTKIQAVDKSANKQQLLALRQQLQQQHQQLAQLQQKNKQYLAVISLQGI